MENTTAVVFMSKMQHSKRENLDFTGEDIVSHELFHHWFGDLVTCESWSNIPLNESFADYGEYLWNEHEHGREEADYHLQQDNFKYFNESRFVREPLIRFYYNSPDDLFDRHTYQKGGAILHMLRKQVGDKAFFAALHLYLERRQFKTAEYTNLRLAFEDVTGQDMNWFFNQWFLEPGHPVLQIDHQYIDSLHKCQIIVQAAADTKRFPVYRLPVQLKVYMNGTPKIISAVIAKKQDTIRFDVPEKPDVVIFDSQDMLLARKDENKPDADWLYQFDVSSRYFERYDAMKHYLADAAHIRRDSVVNFIHHTLNDHFWGIRKNSAGAPGFLCRGI